MEFSKTGEVLVDFYLGYCPDSQGRKIEEIWLWTFSKLEYTHDYVQWLFPLKEKSNFNRNAPTLNEATIQAFRTSEKLKSRLLKSFEVMLDFYGLTINEQNSSTIEIIKAYNYLERKKQWMNLRNHNYLRITRILTSLKTLGLESYSLAFFKCLDQIYKEEQYVIGDESYTFWKNTVNDLH